MQKWETKLSTWTKGHHGDGAGKDAAHATEGNVAGKIAEDVDRHLVLKEAINHKRSL